MKVFTVGLDQKPPLEEVKGSGTEKESPPPGYSTAEARVPLPLGPALPRPPLPPQPIIVRKHRGYKGILLVLLTVFLMAAFALTLSELAYNRQREENFFKLRWAELKHRMGYENAGPFDYYHRASSSLGEKFDRLFSLAKINELSSSASMERDPTTTSPLPSTPAQTSEPVVAIDSFPPMPNRARQPFSGFMQNSVEVEQPLMQQMFGNGMAAAPLGQQVRGGDARLQFLRNILQKIKQHAEDMGMEGTMQVSIIEVEPQNGAGADAAGAETTPQQQQPQQDNNNIWGAQQRAGAEMAQPQQQQQQQASFPTQMAFPTPQHFFPHPRPLIDDFKNSRSFLDGFGEFHPPSFVQNNHVAEQEERPRMFGPWAQQQQQQQQMPNMPNEFQQQQQQQQQQNGPDFMESIRWPRINPFRQQQQQQPEMFFFRPMFPQQMNLRFPPIQPPQVNNNEWSQQQNMPSQPQQQQQQNGAALPRPSAFDRWNGPSSAASFNGIFVPPPPAQQPQQQMEQQQQQQVEQQQQQQSVAQQQQTPAQQQQTQQIDFPEVKLPPPIISNNDNDNKLQLPMGPPTEQSPAAQQQNQQRQETDIPRWLPKWSTSSSSSAVDKADNDNSKDDDDNEDNNNNNNANRGGAMFIGAGPPSAQPSDIVKFPAVTVVEPAAAARIVDQHDDDVAGDDLKQSMPADQPPPPAMAPPPASPTATEQAQVQAAAAASGVTATASQTEQVSEKKEQPDEVVEVDAPQPIVPQNQQQPAQPQQQQPEAPKSAPASDDQQQQLQRQQQPSPPGISPLQQKWFPEVPSVFFQNDNSSEEIEKTEKVFDSMVDNMRRMIGNMFKVDDSDSTEIVQQVDDPNGGNAGGTDEVNMPKPAELVGATDGAAAEQQQQQMQRPRQPHMVVD